MEHRMRSTRAAIDMAHEHGITAIIEPGIDAEMIEPILRIADAGQLQLGHAFRSLRLRGIPAGSTTTSSISFSNAFASADPTWMSIR